MQQRIFMLGFAWGVVALLATSFAAGAEQPAVESLPPKVDHILLEVANLDASIAFYRDLLGLKLKSKRGDFATLEAGRTGVDLWSKRWDWEAPRQKGERQGLGIYPHLKVDDVSALVKRARQAGYKIIQEPKWHLYGTEAFIADPDGYIWALIS